MDELLEQFLIESRELVAQAGKDFATLSRDPRNISAIDSVFRTFHTLKGSFAIFGLHAAERLLHGGEDVLQGARQQSFMLQPAMLTALTACLDQIDRWIDAMDSEAALPPDAEAVSARMLARLTTEPGMTPLPLEQPGKHVQPDWLSDLMTREGAVVEQAQDPLTAFRYKPDADCFFRGEDPLAVVEALPLLEALAILPAQGAWPSGDDLDPFACFSVIEGLSKANEAELRAAFRLQPDQVEFAVITPRAETGEAGASPRETTLLRVEAARIDTLADGLAQLVITTNGLAAIAQDLEATDPFLATRLRAAQADVERIATTLHGDLAQLRLVTLAPALRRLPRAAREIAQALGKDVAFTIEGEAVEADKQIAEGLFEPLLHLMRNAIDHGIEAPDLRRSLGKPVQGQVRLVLAREGKAITATISDDGRGIDPVRLRHLAVERGLLSDAQAEALDDRGALRLIFHPGFSTAGTVTDLSGRGVGMDAVQAAVTRLRGSIRIESTQGTGTQFCMVFPAHALTTRLLVIRLGTECFGVSLDQVVETARIATSAIRSVGTGQACILRGETVPVLDLAAMLDVASMDDPVTRLIITRVDGRPVALRVHGFSQRIDTVLRPPRGMLARTHGIMGSALLGDGGVLLVLDLTELAA